MKLWQKYFDWFSVFTPNIVEIVKEIVAATEELLCLKNAGNQISMFSFKMNGLNPEKPNKNILGAS